MATYPNFPSTAMFSDVPPDFIQWGETQSTQSNVSPAFPSSLAYPTPANLPKWAPLETAEAVTCATPS